MGNQIKKHSSEVLTPVITAETLNALSEQSTLNKFNITKEILYNIDARELIKEAGENNQKSVTIIENRSDQSHLVQCSHLEELFPEYQKHFNEVLKIDVQLKLVKYENQGRCRNITRVFYKADWSPPITDNAIQVD